MVPPVRSFGGIAHAERIASVLSHSIGLMASASSYGMPPRTSASMSACSGHAWDSAVGLDGSGFLGFVGFCSVAWSSLVPKERAFRKVDAHRLEQVEVLLRVGRQGEPECVELVIGHVG